MAESTKPLPNPYVGPRSFRYGEKLYGREQEVPALLDLLIAERIVLLYSPSGAGKTSLVQAALIPELMNEEFDVLPVMRVNKELPPELKGVKGANRYLVSLFLYLEEGLPRDQQTPLTEIPRIKFTDYLNRRQAKTNGGKPLVLIFDQFEEVLTVDPTDRAAKEAFFAQVGTALRDRERWALFVMREEYLAGMDPYLRAIPTRFVNSFRLELLGKDAATRAVQEPASNVSVIFKDSAAKILVDDLSRISVQQADGTMVRQDGLYVEPVQLQVVCSRLWEKEPRKANQTIDEEAIKDLGDVDNALAGYYADKVKAVAAETGVKERLIREWFDRQLITEHGIRGQVLLGPDASGALDNRAIRPLVDAHLVRGERVRGATWFELAHDRLIKPIQTDNREWHERNLNTLQRRATIWFDEGRPNGLLLSITELKEAERWITDTDNKLEPREEEFFNACKEKRTRRNLLIALRALLVCITFIAVLVSLYALSEQKSARSRELAAIAHNLLTYDSELSLLLAKEAVRISHTTVAEKILRESLVSFHDSHRRAALIGHAEALRCASFSFGGNRIVTTSEDKSVRVWDASTGKQLFELDKESRHGKIVYSAYFSPDNSRIVTASEDGTARIWDTASGKMLFTLTGHLTSVRSAAFNRNGDRIVTASEDKTVKVWDVATGKQLFELDKESQHKGIVYSAYFSPSGDRILSSGGDKKVKVWDATTGRMIFELAEHDDSVRGAAFSPNGDFILTASKDRKLRLWSCESQKLIFQYEHSDWVHSAAFSPDGKYFASACGDGILRVWDTASLDLLYELAWHKGTINQVAFSTDSKFIVTAGADKAARVWELNIEKKIFKPYMHADSVRSVVFSRDGSQLLTAGEDGRALVWGTAEGNILLELPSHKGWVRQARIQSDRNSDTYGKRRKCAPALLLSSYPGQLIHEIKGQADWVYGADISPDDN